MSPHFKENVTIVDLEELQVSATLELCPGEGKEATLLIEVEMEVDGVWDPDCWTSEITSLTQELDPDDRALEKG